MTRRTLLLAVSAASVVAVLAVCAACFAQDAKPWEQPGTPGAQIVGPDGGKMVWVPAGEFVMGSPEIHPDADPPHRVRITKGFWLGKCEVTHAQYRAYWKAAFLGAGDGLLISELPQRPMFATWLDAYNYCKYYGLCMPTEAQWEYAARGPEGRKYPWGNEWDPKKCCNWNNQGAFVIATNPATTMDVGSLPAGDGWVGASDMAGNAGEWCADWYGQDYYKTSPPEDPQNQDAGQFPARVYRGGSCMVNDSKCLSALRYADDANVSEGFRVVKIP